MDTCMYMRRQVYMYMTGYSDFYPSVKAAFCENVCKNVYESVNDYLKCLNFTH